MVTPEQPPAIFMQMVDRGLSNERWYQVIDKTRARDKRLVAEFKDEESAIALLHKLVPPIVTLIEQS